MSLSGRKTHLDRYRYTRKEPLIQTRKDQLPKKSKGNGPQVYWITAPTHCGFSKATYDVRTKFNYCLDSVVRMYANMCTVQLKVNWRPNDTTLVVNDKFTITGMNAYWKAVDSALEFNIKKREEYLVREKLKSSGENKKKCTPFAMGRPSAEMFNKNKDAMREFFARRNANKGCPKSREFRTEDDRRPQNNRFLLPKPRKY